MAKSDLILKEKALGSNSTASPSWLWPGPFLGPVQYDVVVNSMGSGARLCRLKTQIYDLTSYTALGNLFNL